MSRIVQLVVALTMVSVLLVTILPLPHLTAPRTATEGPVSTFQSLRFARRLLMGIKVAANLVFSLICSLFDFPRTAKALTLSTVLRF